MRMQEYSDTSQTRAFWIYAQFTIYHDATTSPPDYVILCVHQFHTTSEVEMIYHIEATTYVFPPGKAGFTVAPQLKRNRSISAC